MQDLIQFIYLFALQDKLPLKATPCEDSNEYTLTIIGGRPGDLLFTPTAVLLHPERAAIIW